MRGHSTNVHVQTDEVRMLYGASLFISGDCSDLEIYEVNYEVLLVELMFYGLVGIFVPLFMSYKLMGTKMISSLMKYI